jgi:antitoxin YefM
MILSNYISMGNIMRHVSYSAARANLAATMDEVVNDRMPTIITRQNGNNCILMSYDEFTSLEETARLYRSPANAKHLLRSLEQINNGQLQEHDLQDE